MKAVDLVLRGFLLIAAAGFFPAAAQDVELHVTPSQVFATGQGQFFEINLTVTNNLNRPLDVEVVTTGSATEDLFFDVGLSRSLLQDCVLNVPPPPILPPPLVFLPLEITGLAASETARCHVAYFQFLPADVTTQNLVFTAREAGTGVTLSETVSVIVVFGQPPNSVPINETAVIALALMLLAIGGLRLARR